MPNVCLYLQSPHDPRTEWKADLRDPQGIALTFSVNDLAQLSQPQNPFAKNLTLAGTKNTHEAFRHAYRMDLTTQEVIGQGLPARLVVDGVDVLKGSGVLQVESFLHNPDGTVDYECDLTGGGYSWMAEADRLKWCDIDLGDIVWDDVLPVVTWDKATNPWDYAGCTFFPVHYGWWMNGSTYISRYDLRPHLYIRWMLEKAFLHLGFTLSGAYINTTRFTSLVHLFTRGKWGVTQEQADILNGASTSQDILRRYAPIPNLPIAPPTYEYFTSTALGSSNNPYWSADTWTQPFTARVRLCFTIGAGMTVAQNIDWVFELNGVEEVATLTSYSAITGMTMCWKTCLAEGDEIKIKAKHGVYDPLFVNYMDITAGAGNFEVTCEVTSYPCDGETIPLCTVIDPSLSVLDVIKGVTHLENLYWITDAVNGTVTPYRAGEYTPIAQVGEDWTVYLDCGGTMQVKPISTECRNYMIGFKEDNADLLLKWWAEQEGENLYDSEQVVDGLNPCRQDNRNPTYAATFQVNEKRGIYKDLSQTGMTGGGSSFLPIWLGMRKNALKGVIADNDPADIISHDHEPRIALYEGLQDATDLGWFTSVGWTYDNEDGTGQVTQTDYPHAYLMDWWNATRAGIGYGSEQFYTQAPDMGPGVLATAPGQDVDAWEKTLQANANGRIVEATGRLTAAQVQALDFSTPKRITGALLGQAMYQLVSVEDWNPDTGICKVKLFVLR